MSHKVSISLKLPEDLYAQLALSVPEGDRSVFIRDAIIEKMQRIVRPNKILEIDRKIQSLESEIALIKKCLADLELLTYEKGKVNPHIFCIDHVDHVIVDYLVHYRGATTPELAEALHVNRWLVLNRLKRIRRRSEKQLGKPVIVYVAREKAGKKKAWWLGKEFIVGSKEDTEETTR